ncbi:hypothetical protein E2C01_101258 [Portunus trituberculatus]|uniref:Uncharacterized protein n=1 Tax=Portunus trituberculatus TaxID=210409 RepID=A0A5B7K943_PORTR|nr:hypothetical protein [Portunus trituberculatus]
MEGLGWDAEPTPEEEESTTTITTTKILNTSAPHLHYFQETLIEINQERITENHADNLTPLESK